MFSYWGNHGLGDYARIPIGFNKQVECINGTWSYISPAGHENEMYSIESYAVKNKYCTGLSNNSEYYIWNLESNEIETLNSKLEYAKKLTKLNIPKTTDFKSFWEGYNQYWNRWRFWLLP